MDRGAARPRRLSADLVSTLGHGQAAIWQSFPSPRQIPRDDLSFCSSVAAIPGLMSNGAFYRERVGEEEEEEEEEEE